MFNPLNLITKFIKSSNQKELDRIGKIVEKINSHEEDFKNLNDDDFPKKTNEFRNQLKDGKTLDELLPEAFALVREAAKRTRNERHFNVQLIGGVALHEGKIAEMRTGEGKTLTITLAAYLNALSEKGVHIVTVNDYLAKRDSIEMGEIYNFLGLTSGFINNYQDDTERKKNYKCDITYATNSELGFDYLRDNMKFSEEQMVQREHNFSIVDEIDSCLIDEARTPLVISGAAEDKTAQYLAIDKLIRNLNDKDYEIDEKEKSVLLTNNGINNVEKLFSNAGILKNNNFYYLLGLTTGYASLTFGGWQLLFIISLINIYIFEKKNYLVSLFKFFILFISIYLSWGIYTNSYFGTPFYSNLNFYPFVESWGEMMNSTKKPNISELLIKLDYLQYIKNHFVWFIKNIVNLSLFNFPTFIFFEIFFFVNYFIWSVCFFSSCFVFRMWSLP